MYDNLVNLDRIAIRERYEMLRSRDVPQTVRTGNLLNIDHSNPFHRLVLVLNDEFQQRMGNVTHHLGWADKFEESAHDSNTISAAVALLQAEALAMQILVLSGEYRHVV